MLPAGLPAEVADPATPERLAELALAGNLYGFWSSLGVADPGLLSSRLRNRFRAEATVLTRDKVPETLTSEGEEPRRIFPLPAEK